MEIWALCKLRVLDYVVINLGTLLLATARGAPKTDCNKAWDFIRWVTLHDGCQKISKFEIGGFYLFVLSCRSSSQHKPYNHSALQCGVRRRALCQSKCEKPCSVPPPFCDPPPTVAMTTRSEITDIAGTQARGSSCLGQGGNKDGPCIFPFKYRGTWHTQCGDYGNYGNGDWCATEVDDNGEYTKFGFCTRTSRVRCVPA